MVTKISSGDARANWRDILDQVSAGKADIIIERSGKEVAVLIPVEDYEAIQEELDEMRAARNANEAYQEWLQNPDVARPWEEVERDLIQKGRLDA